ncbi:methyltransferase domain-containing protein [Streptomyces olivaceus]|uniref:Methyltransferase domain-containing protein n=1 Tax=Streptomyces olivaceus TaxID=47716 RepID=A0ABS7W778_STROV|nr:methyltransferase domain-containing protein [Streptomyces olivaceus]MBZ6090842.1 methyltransferase domain-containing protein [Streptomyces olivaceus]MBZ6097017.1 methyltransferase domain-containing protein [Streptomyces olivaceus]MBZ6119446.1 methyltransferase domain-containing protein [Streptomyces olivaceus]MBZ6153342.1 methyltransferase domain-containing protein [Streptomyces olivaceus]MBZ6299425.1 methyltransferase domain-containing protein [Streptomyces olivaceus]
MPAVLPPALAPLLDSLRCPVCGAALQPAQGALRCPTGHTFNIARQGYVSLLTGTRALSGDDTAMVQARTRFLATGTYAPVSRVLTHLAAEAMPTRGTVLDAGCGTGYYLAGVLDRLPTARGLGLDASVRALRSAVRSHERAAAASWDVFRPFPLADQAVDVVLNVFAPRNPPEFHRVLRGSGRLIVVRPTHQHLAELHAHVPGTVTIDPDKERRLRRALGPFFEAAGTRRLEYPARLTSQEAADLVGMTPSARHLGQEDLAGRGALPDRITVSVLATSYRPRGAPTRTGSETRAIRRGRR